MLFYRSPRPMNQLTSLQWSSQLKIYFKVIGSYLTGWDAFVLVFVFPLMSMLIIYGLDLWFPEFSGVPETHQIRFLIETLPPEKEGERQLIVMLLMGMGLLMALALRIVMLLSANPFSTPSVQEVWESLIKHHGLYWYIGMILIHFPLNALLPELPGTKKPEHVLFCHYMALIAGLSCTGWLLIPFLYLVDHSLLVGQQSGSGDEKGLHKIGKVSQILMGEAWNMGKEGLLWAVRRVQKQFSKDGCHQKLKRLSNSINRSDLFFGVSMVGMFVAEAGLIHPLVLGWKEIPNDPWSWKEGLYEGWFFLGVTIGFWAMKKINLGTWLDRYGKEWETAKISWFIGNALYVGIINELLWNRNTVDLNQTGTPFTHEWAGSYGTIIVLNWFFPAIQGGLTGLKAGRQAWAHQARLLRSDQKLTLWNLGSVLGKTLWKLGVSLKKIIQKGYSYSTIHFVERVNAQQEELARAEESLLEKTIRQRPSHSGPAAKKRARL